jgi:3-isopropylmalate/(R)-2-methylmalate dehydratase small subunit
MQRIKPFTSTAVVLPVDNIDTDQIIPARYLKSTDKSGLGEGLFADWRYGPDGALREEFPLNRPSARSARVLIAGENFGCGSSREHAPWALLAFGFRAVISTRFADIFKNNALGNGLLPIVLRASAHARLVDILNVEPAAELHVDLANQMLTLPDGSVELLPIEPFDRYCLMRGEDRLDFLLGAAPDIDLFEHSGP